MTNTTQYQLLPFYQQWLEHQPAGQNFCYDYSVRTGDGSQEQFTATIHLNTLAKDEAGRKGILYNRILAPVNTVDPFLELASVSGKCFYPVQLFQRDNEWEVGNREALIKNWLTIKERLLLEFEGPVAAMVLQQTETVLESPARLRKIYKEDLFLNLHFSLIDDRWTAASDREFSLPLIPGAEAVLFNGSQTIKAVGADWVEMSIDATCIDPRTYGALFYGKDTGETAVRNELSVQGFLKGLYKLDPAVYCIRKIDANIELGEPGGATRSWQIKINTCNDE
ncbi:MAG: hypothetical protein J7539_18600 [Niabella sp.]|nr:hypothetical protein [Niabella sp.]